MVKLYHHRKTLPNQATVDVLMNSKRKYFIKVYLSQRQQPLSTIVLITSKQQHNMRKTCEKLNKAEIYINANVPIFVSLMI